MELYEALDLVLAAGENVDGHWRQFYAFLFGLAAWFSSNFVSLGKREAIIISLATTAFFAVNAIATARAYVILRLLALETRAIAERSTFASAEVVRAVQRKRLSSTFPHRITMTILAHVIAAAAIIELMWKTVR